MSSRSFLTGALAALVFVTASCGGDSDEPGPSPVPPAETTTPPPMTATTHTPPTTTTTTTSTRPPEASSSTAAISPPEDAEPTIEQTERVTLLHGGRTRVYNLFIPAGISAPAPLMLDLHGLTADPDKQDRLSAMRDKASESGFVVAQPEAVLVANAWDTLEGSDDVSFLVAVVEDTAGRVPIDPDRVYAAGFSAGGGMAARLGCDAAGTFAAVAVVSAAHIGHRRCTPERPMPVVAIHGDADVVVPLGGFGLLPDIPDWAAAWASRNSCKPAPLVTSVSDDVTLSSWTACSGDADVRLYVVEGGGHGWPGTPDPGRVGDTTDSVSATDVIWEFFVAHPMDRLR